MAVLMIGEVPNLTEEIYSGMLEQMKPLMRAAQGFIAHSGGPHPNGGWRVVETVGVRSRRSVMVRRQRQAQAAARCRAHPHVLPAAQRLHGIAQPRQSGFLDAAVASNGTGVRYRQPKRPCGCDVRPRVPSSLRTVGRHTASVEPGSSGRRRAVSTWTPGPIVEETVILRR